MQLVNTELLTTTNKTEENYKYISPILNYIKNLFYRMYNYIYERRYIIIENRIFQIIMLIIVLCIIIKIFQNKYKEKESENLQ